MSYRKKLRQKIILGVWGGCLLVPVTVMAGAYLLSAHGSSSIGVARPAMTSAGYGRGNCAHCHEMHASLGGVEPAPVGGAPSPYTLFAVSNDFGKPYTQSSNFCFNCHSDLGSVQQVINMDYSQRFGGGDSSGSQSIMSAFNLASSHNLSDIKTFLGNNPGTYPWFSSSYSNPCNGCHNPHLAKRNWVAIPSNSAISKPSGVNHFSLWGEASPQLMSSYSYEAPYSTFQTNYVAVYREPNAGSTTDGSITPDYVGFCTDCHNTQTTISSSTLGIVKKIDWSVSTGDIHGGFQRYYNSISLRQPYSTASQAKSNLVLSCLDCHEPHGSSNIMLLRRRINGQNLEGTITTTNVMGYACRRCHLDDLLANAGTITLNKWQYVHHLVTNAPYPNPVQCSSCHGGTPSSNPIPCGNCHFHGGTDSWLATIGKTPTYRKTF